MDIMTFSLIVVALYAGLTWFSLRRQRSKAAAIRYYGATATVLLLAYITQATDLLWALLLAIGIMSAVFIIERNQPESLGPAIINGLFGGVWLSLPIYAAIA